MDALDYTNAYRTKAYYFPAGFPAHLKFPYFWQSFDKAFEKLLDRSSAVDLLVCPSPDSKGYVVDVATGISIPIVSYEKYTNRDYALRQVDRVETSMDSKFSFCTFTNICLEDKLSSDEIQQYIRDNHAANHYNLLLEYANQNCYLQNPNEGKEPMSTISVESTLEGVSNSMDFIHKVNQLQAKITELDPVYQAQFSEMLASVLNDYSVQSSNQSSIGLDFSLSTYIHRLEDLEDNIHMIIQKSIDNSSYDLNAFLQVVRNISEFTDSNERMKVLYEEMAYLSKIPITSSLEEQLAIVDQFVEVAIENFCLLPLEQREKYWNPLDNNYQREFISKLEREIFGDDVLAGRKFSDVGTSENTFSYFNELIDRRIKLSSNTKNTVK